MSLLWAHSLEGAAMMIFLLLCTAALSVLGITVVLALCKAAKCGDAGLERDGE